MTTYIPSRIDSVLRNLTDQAELWQKEAQYRQKMGVELYELGLKSNRSDLMEQGVNMIERRDTLARPFAKRFQFNYEGSGLKREDMIDSPTAPVAPSSQRYAPKTADEILAHYRSMNEKETAETKQSPFDYLKQFDLSKMGDNEKLRLFSYMGNLDPVSSNVMDINKYPDEVDLVKRANPYMPDPFATDDMKRARTELKSGIKTEAEQAAGSFAERDTAYRSGAHKQLLAHKEKVKADALRFTNEMGGYNTRKEKVEAANRRAMEMNAEIDEIDRMITSKDGQVRAEGYRRLHEYEVDKAGNSERAIVAADNRYQSNMANLMLHYNDQIDPRVFGTRRNFGGGGAGYKTKPWTAFVPDKKTGKMVEASYNIPEGTPNIEEWIAKKEGIDRSFVKKAAPSAGVNEYGRSKSETEQYALDMVGVKSLQELSDKMNDEIGSWWSSDKTDRQNARNKWLPTLIGLNMVADKSPGGGIKLVPADGRLENGMPYINVGKGIIMLADGTPASSSIIRSDVDSEIAGYENSAR